MRVSNSDEVLLPLGKCTTDDTMVSLDVELRESRVLEGVEAEETVLEFRVINATNVVLSITDSNKILICRINVDACDLTAFSQVVTLESE